MKWAEISVKTSHEATETVANLFHELGAAGVVIEDLELINRYRESGLWDYTDIPKQEHTEVVTVQAYFPLDEGLQKKLDLLAEQVQELATYHLDKGPGQIYWREVQEEDWETSWKQYFHPIRVGKRIVIKPTWEQYEAKSDDLIIELDPGMAFGTGTHHTTAMCMSALEDTLKPGDSVFDVGTGSGILAITAAKLGASSVKAVDLDQVAVRVARENCELNKVQDQVTVTHGDLLTGITGQADLIVANIIAAIIIQLLPDIPVRLKPNGIFLASGIIVERLEDVKKAMNNQGLEIVSIREQGGWAVVKAKRNQA